MTKLHCVKFSETKHKLEKKTYLLSVVLPSLLQVYFISIFLILPPNKLSFEFAKVRAMI